MLTRNLAGHYTPLGKRKVSQVTVDGTEGDVTVARLWRREYALLHLAQPQPKYNVQVDFSRRGLCDH